MSIYALTRATAAILSSHQIGWYIDTQERLSVVRLSVVGQRIAVIFSCVGFLTLVTMLSDVSSVLNKAVFGVLILLACVDKLCSMMKMVAVERDWVVVMAGGDKNALQELNSQMRRIDLFCKLVSPLAMALLNGVSTKTALLATMVLNICSLTVEYPFIFRVYLETPALDRAWSGPNTSENVASMSQSSTSEQHVIERTDPVVENLAYTKDTVIATFKAYVHSSAFLPSLTLSILYLNVLSFSGQMITFLLAVPHPKMSSTTIGLVRTGATVLEISATFVAPRIMAAVGSVRAGMWCLSWQLLCLTPAVGLLWSQHTNSASKVICFVIVVVLSRIGLWSFDLVAQLLIQNSIDPCHRGSFSSTEASLQNFFELCTFALTIAFPKPEQFKYPGFVSLIAMYCAAVLYAKFVQDRSGHSIQVPNWLQHSVEQIVRW